MEEKRSWSSYQNDISGTGTKVDQNSTDESYTAQTHMSQFRILKNLLIVCLGSLFLFCAYQGTANLQSTLNKEDSIGVISLSVIYAATILASLFLVKLIIKKFGCKTTLVVSALLYVPFIGVNFNSPSLFTFVPASAIVGVAGTALWSAQATYINEISVLYSRQSTDSLEVVTSRFFGMFFLAYQSTQIWSNLVSYFILKPESGFQNETIHFLSHNTEANTCGAGYCSEINENLKEPSEEKRYTLIGIYILFVLLSVLVMAVFLDKLERTIDEGESLISKTLATLKHMKKPKQILLMPLTIFMGLEQGFFLADFTMAYVACAWGIYNVGLVFAFYGIVDSIVSVIAGRLIKYLPRLLIMITACLANLLVCIVLLFWHPNSDQYIIFFILAGTWGFCDGILQPNFNALYGLLFRSEEEAAFSNYRLWEGVGYAIVFGSSSLLCMTSKIYIFLTMLIVGFIGYITVELLLIFEAKRNKISSNNIMDVGIK